MDFSLLTSSSTQVGGWILAFIAVSFAAIQAYSRGFSDTQIIKDNAAKDLVTILQATVETLKGEMRELQKNHLLNVEAIASLRGENATLAKILQGRDDTYLKFQQEGFLAFKKIEENSNSIKELVKLLDKHLNHK